MPSEARCTQTLAHIAGACSPIPAVNTISSRAISSSLHGFTVFTSERGAVEIGAMAQRVLRCRNVSLLAVPDFQGWLLERTGKREHQ